jgi:hypothetical protein
MTMTKGDMTINKNEGRRHLAMTAAATSSPWHAGGEVVIVVDDVSFVPPTPLS